MKEFEEISQDYSTNAYATHQPCLLWALNQTNGNILELGVGDSSTPIINKNSNARKIVSVDDSRKWIEKVYALKSEKHEFILIEQAKKAWEDFIELASKKTWGLVMVDHGGQEDIWKTTRPLAVKKLLDCCDLVIVHDSDLFPELKTLEANFFEYVPTHKADPNRNGPPTAILSKKTKIAIA